MMHLNLVIKRLVHVKYVDAKSCSRTLRRGCNSRVWLLKKHQLQDALLLPDSTCHLLQPETPMVQYINRQGAGQECLGNTSGVSDSPEMWQNWVYGAVFKGWQCCSEFCSECFSECVQQGYCEACAVRSREAYSEVVEHCYVSSCIGQCALCYCHQEGHHGIPYCNVLQEHAVDCVSCGTDCKTVAAKSELIPGHVSAALMQNSDCVHCNLW